MYEPIKINLQDQCPICGKNYSVKVLIVEKDPFLILNQTMKPLDKKRSVKILFLWESMNFSMKSIFIL
jgi:hypothetical protein